MKLVAKVRDLEWRRGFYEWCRTDGVTWVFIFKTLLAAFVTLGLAMYFEFPQPRVSAVSVFIVMQIQSGAVLAKAFYRLAGTIVGAGVTVLLVSLMPQDSTLLLTAFAVWIALCCAGAQWHRNVRGYGFVLAGYTTATIGLPILAHPNDVLLSAAWRIVEISLGIFVSSAITACVFPKTTGAAMRDALYHRLGDLNALLSHSIAGTLSALERQRTYSRFAAEAVGLEGLRAITAFENPHLRQQNRRLSRLNKEFMTLCTRLSALQQYLDHIGHDSLAALSISPALRELGRLSDSVPHRSVTNLDAIELAQRVLELKSRTAVLQSNLSSSPKPHHSPESCLEASTAAELLAAFLDEFQAYLDTHARLGESERDKEDWRYHFRSHTSGFAALAAGVRGGIVVLLLGMFWLQTGWPSGAMATLIGASTVALASTTPNPRGLAFQIAMGTIVGATLGGIEYFLVYPLIDGFPLLCFALAPVICLGAFLISRPKWFGYGAGVLVFFAVASLPDNPTHYDPYGFINDYIGMIVAMLVSAVAGAVILPPNRPWLIRRLEGDLRKAAASVIHSPLEGLSNAFESRVRDIVQQAYGLTSNHPDQLRELIRWMFMVLGVGHAVIEIRHDAPRHSKSLAAALEAIARLFGDPGLDNVQAALQVLEGTLTLCNQDAALKRSASYLELIRTSLHRFEWTHDGASISQTPR